MPSTSSSSRPRRCTSATPRVSARSLVGPDTVVLPIQNGLGSARRRRRRARRGLRRSRGGREASGRRSSRPGTHITTGYELIRLGERRGPVTRADRARRRRLARRRLHRQTDDDVDRLVWEKLICNVCFSGTCTVLGLDDRRGDGRAGSLARRRHVRHRGVRRGAGDRDLAFASTIPSSTCRPSGRGSRTRGRRCCSTGLAGQVERDRRRSTARSRRGRQHSGLTAPCNATLTALIKALEATDQE